MNWHFYKVFIKADNKRYSEMYIETFSIQHLHSKSHFLKLGLKNMLICSTGNTIIIIWNKGIFLDVVHL